MDGLVGSVTGDRIIKEHLEGNIEEAEIIGIRLGEKLLSRGPTKFLPRSTAVRSNQ